MAARKSKTARYGVWRYFKDAHFESVEDGSLLLPSAVIQQILGVAGFKSVRSFNQALKRYGFGKIPQTVHERLEGLLDLTTCDDWSLLTLSGRSLTTGFIEVESPLMLADEAPAPMITINAMAFEAFQGGHSFHLSASVTSPSQFKAKPGQQEICSLLIEKRNGPYARLQPRQRKLFADWLVKNGVEPLKPAEAFEEARAGIRRAAERIGMMSKTFPLGKKQEADYFVECSSGEESGFSTGS